MAREDDLYRGMTVVDRNDERLGEVESIVKDRASRELESIAVGGRLVPVADIEDVDQGRVRLGIDADRLSDYPIERDEAMPVQADPKARFQAVGLDRDVKTEPLDTDLEPDQMDDRDRTPGV